MAGSGWTRDLLQTPEPCLWSDAGLPTMTERAALADMTITELFKYKFFIFLKITVIIAGKPLIHKNQNIQLAFLMGGVPFFIFSSSFMIFLSFCSSGLSVDSSTSTYADTQVIKCRSHDSTNMILMFLQFHNFFFKILTSSLSKYWISSGLRKGRFPEGWSFICFTVRSSACMWKPVMPPIGVGVAESLRAGVRMGT